MSVYRGAAQAQCHLLWQPLGDAQVVGFARIPIFAVETPGTLASPTTKVDGIGGKPGGNT
ncbi:hypothetical protein RMSM_04263 [Rhodopirellula maiorica SM1]|uniref:Uncharacterized protein n=1 Tax=Rhodopirellula maiorica SM1 TaxID=1265738 RepID=M5RHQ6_9BACT|nr:hypothetical protein RMSM_04263 [Rhodopirellula maiorica SM1]